MVVEKTLDRFGRLDALVNNAGIFEPMSFIADADTDAWRYNLEVNVFGPFCLARAAIPALRKQAGRVINVSSGASHIPIEAGSAYCVSKAALTHLTRVLAAEETDLTCISIRPGVVDTAMQAYIRDDGPKIMPADKASYYLGLKEKGQLEPPERPARSIAWLSLHGPHDWSGDFMDYDDPSIIEASIAFFGEDSDL
jgi:NAD(P)-dependent dehydrogenase (short-subunit alcohol dehydrogenase family)